MVCFFVNLERNDIEIQSPGLVIWISRDRCASKAIGTEKRISIGCQFFDSDLNHNDF